MKNLLFHLKAVETGTLKAQVGAVSVAGAETFWKSEPEPKQLVTALQHCWNGRIGQVRPEQAQAGRKITEKWEKFDTTN
jgi:hypothetical protein